jgi:predicted Ser/Thr protein kinase
VTADQHARCKEIFLEACGQPEADRPAFVARACAGEDSILREVERLLSHHQASPPPASTHPSTSRSNLKDLVREITELPTFQTGDLIADRYCIVSLLGEGAMGRVYRAEDIRLHQSVALKFLPRLQVLDPTWRRRVESEVKLSREVGHSNICRVYDLGEVDGAPFISMEYIDGEDLAALLRRVGRLTGTRAIDIARQICAGLAAAHIHGVLHRDLKPANIMIDHEGRVRITDFGLAVMSGHVEQKEIRAGTPRYMAPEQLGGIAVDEKSDIYSLGLVLYEMFTGRPAFDADGVLEYLRLHRTIEPVPPSTIVPEIDPKVEAVILACLRKDPAERPESALNVAAALPGGDLLAAALDAGQIPTREMLATAAAQGGICKRGMYKVAVISAVLFASAILLGHDTHPIAKNGGVKSPEFLFDKACEISKLAGQTPPTNRADGRFIPAADAGFAIITSGEELLYYYRENADDAPGSTIDVLSFIMPGPNPLQIESRPGPSTRIILDGQGQLVRTLPDGQASNSVQPRPTASAAQSQWMLIRALRNTVLIVLLAIAIPAAWINWKRRGDLTGAARLGGFVLSLRLISGLLSFRNSGGYAEAIDDLANLAVSALSEGTIVAFFYLAMETQVRELWPRTLGCWSRLLAGRFRDPFVGRDVLLGCTIGNFWAILAFLDRRIPEWMGWQTRTQLRLYQGLDDVLGVRAAVAGVFNSLRTGIYQALAMLLILVIATWLAGRRRWLALFFAWLIGAAMYAPTASHPVTAWTLVALGIVPLALHVLIRWGLVSLLSAILVAAFLTVFPITTDLNTWFAGYSAFACAATLGLGLWGLRESTRPPILETRRSLPL